MPLVNYLQNVNSIIFTNYKSMSWGQIHSFMCLFNKYLLSVHDERKTVLDIMHANMMSNHLKLSRYGRNKNIAMGQVCWENTINKLGKAEIFDFAEVKPDV